MTFYACLWNVFSLCKGVTVSNLVLQYLNRDERPAFVLEDGHNASFFQIDAQKGVSAPQFILTNISNISIHEVNGVDDMKLDEANKKEI